MTPEREKRIRGAASRRQLDLAVVLENVHDSHNVGAVLRSCDAVGVQKVFALYTDPDINLRKVQLGKRTSAGARKWVDVYLFTDMEQCVAEVRKYCDVLLATHIGSTSKSIYDVDFTRSAAVLFGNEHTGLSEELRAHADSEIYIPQAGMVQSLNISVACAVTLYEALRQRQQAGFYTDNPTQAEGRGEALLEEWFDHHSTQHTGRIPRRDGED